MADLNSLSIFARVAETGSFSEAGRRLGMPVSSVSRRIADLEHQLGVRLIERSTRSLRLTEVGAELLPYAQRSAELSDTVESIVSRNLAEVSGTLRLSAPPSLSDLMITPMVQTFQASYPKVRVSLFVTQRLVDPIADGIDLMLRVGDLVDSSLIAQRLLRYRHQLVASPSYLARCGALEGPDRLSEHRLIGFSSTPGEQRWRFARHGSGDIATVVFAPTLAMNDYMGIAKAALDGAGIAELPPMISGKHVAAGELVELLPEWRLPSRDLSLVQPGGRHPPRPVRLFWELATQLAPKLFPHLPD